MVPACRFKDIARLAEPGDNVAIVSRRLEAGTDVRDDAGASFSLAHTLLEGHRFAVQPIPAGEFVLSWGLPFGRATRDIAPGDYLCNPDILDALRVRKVDFALPDQPNFEDRVVPYELDESTFKAGEQVPLSNRPPEFDGFDRGPARGVGTRNYIILLGITSQSTGFVRRLESLLKGQVDRYPNIDGVVAVAHTEGGSGVDPNNRELVLRTLAGFMVHSNVGAVLAVDRGTEFVSDRMLENYMRLNRYPLNDVPHRFETLKGGFEEDLERCAGIVTGWFETVNRVSRKPASASHLNIVLQCGGSDSFSGISGNPLAALVAREIIRFGGKANLAETDELIGGEPYVLDNVRDIETARTFLHMIERFQERTAWHGQSVDANPSGGNKLRGIYNIVLKSIGAARKRHPDVRLDYAIDYAVPMKDPGYYFMDSPGNDLEAIAGQVASGGNLIFFITGNGSITNFPFVPTIKFVTTTKRYEMLSGEMDVNAGAYLDGVSMEELGGQTLDLTLRAASGELTRGERAGHSQTQIWRDWRQTDGSRLQDLRERPVPAGRPLEVRSNGESTPPPAFSLPVFESNGLRATERIGLILPTSLCSGQIARIAAERLSEKGVGQGAGLSRFVALVHTEGCGVSGGVSEEMYIRTMAGYLTHPMTAAALLLEHGCERTHNDFYRQQLVDRGLDPASFGWASVQLDGGIEKVIDRIEQWFNGTLDECAGPVAVEAGLSTLRLGVATVGLAATAGPATILCPATTAGPVSDDVSETFFKLIFDVVDAGGTVVVPDNDALLEYPAFMRRLEDGTISPTLSYGEPASVPGLHVMETQTAHWVETLTGLGAAGVELVVAGVGGPPLPGHPMIPVLQVAADDLASPFREDVDLILTGEPLNRCQAVLDLIRNTAAGRHAPRTVVVGNTDFQITRGLLGVSV
ncbi:MAG: altronate dehydratase [Gemmatimonadetes bacterium]|nr:altronate dehydratase [Gemmatimonadota bacterium]MYG84478.1 altronate dehydratase [Gemmatimonadota bacterium]MYJ89903.1 altronate dehydratase [Gemmatimonadota bacterium]